MIKKTKNKNINGFKEPLLKNTGELMKKLLIGLLVLGSVSAFSQNAKMSRLVDMTDHGSYRQIGNLLEIPQEKLSDYINAVKLHLPPLDENHFSCKQKGSFTSNWRIDEALDYFDKGYINISNFGLQFEKTDIGNTISGDKLFMNVKTDREYNTIKNIYLAEWKLVQFNRGTLREPDLQYGLDFKADFECNIKH